MTIYRGNVRYCMMWTEKRSIHSIGNSKLEFSHLFSYHYNNTDWMVVNKLLFQGTTRGK